MRWFKRLRWMLRHPGCNWHCAKWPQLCWHLRPEVIEALKKLLQDPDRLPGRKLPPRD